MNKTLSDEQIVAAILQCGTVKAAALHLGISEKTLCARMSKDSYIDLYNATVSGILRHAANSMLEKIDTATETTIAIMKDKNTDSKTRLQAAQTIYAYADKFTAAATAADTAGQNMRIKAKEQRRKDWPFDPIEV